MTLRIRVISALQKLAIWGGILSLLTFLYIRTQSVDIKKHNAITDNFRQLKQLDDNLNLDIFALRFHLLTYYDPTVQKADQLSATFANLKQAMRPLYPVAPPHLMLTVKAYAQILKEKQALLEQFKSSNAVLSNSLHYFPVICTNLNDKLWQHRTDAALRRQMQGLQHDMLLYHLTGDLAIKPRIYRQVVKLYGSGAMCPKEARGDLDLMLAHACIIVRLEGRVDKLVARMTGLPSTEAIDIMYSAYRDHYQHEIYRTNVYRFYLYLACLNLSLYALWVLVKLHRKSQALNIANETLEQRVAERTSALTQSTMEQERAKVHIEHLAYHDALTGLPNRALFADRLGAELSEADHRQRKVGVLFLDLDRFKVINDSLGHKAGDALLQEVAQRLKESVRPSDLVSRLGGDEFVVLLPQIESREALNTVACRIVARMQEPFVLEGKECFVTTSVGGSMYPDDGADVEALMKSSDMAMYHAKGQGRNTFHVFTPAMNRQAIERLTLETSLHKALENHEFLLYYQPQIDLRTGRIYGMEALLRWQHPTRGMISSAEFIPLAEETGLIVPIGQWALHAACIQAREWQQQGTIDLQIGVNISLRQFQQVNLVAEVMRTLRESGLDASCLDLEITETMAMDDMESKVAILQELRRRGLKLTLDDFGTGFSSLNNLRQLPIDTVKMDRAFVQQITGSARDAAIAANIIHLAHTLDLKVVAEGVETREQKALLEQQGCDAIQGYLISRPLPAAEFTRWLEITTRQNEGFARAA